MADTVILRTRKFMRNALLARKQMVVYVTPSLLRMLEGQMGGAAGWRRGTFFRPRHRWRTRDGGEIWGPTFGFRELVADFGSLVTSSMPAKPVRNR